MVRQWTLEWSRACCLEYVKSVNNSGKNEYAVAIYCHYCGNYRPRLIDRLVLLGRQTRTLRGHNWNYYDLSHGRWGVKGEGGIQARLPSVRVRLSTAPFACLVCVCARARVCLFVCLFAAQQRYTGLRPPHFRGFTITSIWTHHIR
jgi:hypothetical protein